VLIGLRLPLFGREPAALATAHRGGYIHNWDVP